MSTAAWTKFGDLARAWPLASRVAYSAFSHTAAILEEKGEQLSPGASLQRGSLQRSFLMLEDLDTVIRNISPERRRKIQAAAERGLCRYMRDVELELQRLYDEYYDLCYLYKKFSFFERHIPITLFHNELLGFESIVNGFLKNVWKTTAPGDRSINWSIIFDWNTDIDRILQTSYSIY